ncbi:MAG TPA: LLM class flavin-dependent oxidoreductase [Streptosporangiaceae bacterium]|nr:LLM class flavin-dependent oxidoreductase [Streptosporangiaceae bacterium]
MPCGRDDRMRFVVRIHQRGWTYPELETVWRESERLGYDGASLYDVLGDSGPECWTALTALTAVTHKLVAVPMVLANPYRHPAVVAKMAATLDALSGGRVILGLGAGGSAADAAAFGVSWPPARDRIAALGEAVEVMRILWRGGGSFGGRWYQLHDAPGYPGTGHPGTGHPGTGRPGGPPVLIGGHGPRLLRTAARHADLCNVGFDLPADRWRDLAPLLGGYLSEAGRSRESLGLTHNATVLLGADESDVARQASAWGARRGLTEEAARGRLGHSLTGTPGQVRERLRALAAAGVGWVFLLFDDLPRLAGLRSFAEAVMPALHTGGDEGAEPP